MFPEFPNCPEWVQYVPDTRRVFLADGDALNLDSEYMIKILKYIREKFANIERISCYAMPMNILKKTPEELRRLMELRRSNAASAVPSKKKYTRKGRKCQSDMLQLKENN